MGQDYNYKFLSTYIVLNNIISYQLENVFRTWKISNTILSMYGVFCNTQQYSSLFNKKSTPRIFLIYSLRLDYFTISKITVASVKTCFTYNVQAGYADDYIKVSKLFNGNLLGIKTCIWKTLTLTDTLNFGTHPYVHSPSFSTFLRIFK